jgi:hypothetical protein
MNFLILMLNWVVVTRWYMSTKIMLVKIMVWNHNYVMFHPNSAMIKIRLFSLSNSEINLRYNDIK